MDFWPGGGGEKPAFERSCYEYRNKRGAREKREYDEYEAVIKVKVAFRVIRDCCSNDLCVRKHVKRYWLRARHVSRILDG